MCGIAGQVSYQLPVSIDLVQNLVRKLNHRGPDDHGVVKTKDGKCVLGHSRLSIIDLSPAGHQPMSDPVAGNVIVFNGEIYNHRELRVGCEQAGYQFKSRTDTEVILALYRRFGVACLSHLRGMFAFALWDKAHKQLFIARDRVGKKPFHYALIANGIVFASEIAALAGYSGISREEDSEALELYLQLQYIPAPWTIYKSIRKLPPAHYAIFNRSGLEISRYWQVDYRNRIQVSQEDALDGLEEKLLEAVRLRMIADVPLGGLLSGGVDSSLVVAMMAKLSGSPIKTFSIGFRHEAYNELPFAQQAADIHGTDHHPEMVDGEVEELLPPIVKHYGEPFADPSTVPSFSVCSTARKHVTVAINGDGGDELLGGYDRYLISSAQQILGKSPLKNFSPHKMVDLLARLRSDNTIHQRLLRKFIRKASVNCGNPEMRFARMYINFWNDEERRRLMGRDLNSGVLAEWKFQRLQEAAQNTDNPIETLLALDNETYLPGDLLVKMDIASMHCGLEARSPLLDQELIEYCASLPVEFKVNKQVGKYLLKKLAERYFPRDFIYRKKMGFSVPLAEWLRGPLRPMLEEVTRDPVAMSPLDTLVIANTLHEFLNQGVNHSMRLWALLMFGLWRKHSVAFFEQQTIRSWRRSQEA